jgi:DNA polymerase-1
MGSLDHVQLHYVDSVDEAMNFKRWLSGRREVLGVDTETEGFWFHRHKIRLVQFGDLNHGWAIPWERWGGVAEEALNAYEGPTVLHNSKFDVNMLTHQAKLRSPWPWYRTHDTMTMSHLTHPLLPHGLKPLGAKLIDQKAAQAQRVLDDGMTDNRWSWETVPLDYPPYWIYAAMDPVLTCHLYEKLKQTISTYARAYQLELDTLRILHNMEQRGALVDLAYCGKMSTELTGYADQARQWIADAYGVQNIGSAPQLIQALEGLGGEITRRTKGGKPSVDKYQLQLFEYAGGEIGQLASVVLKIRKAEKMVTSYFDNFFEMVDSDQRVHPTMWALGTRTARMSVSEPALQTVPKKDGVVRGAFVESPGRHLISSDFAQIEMRLMAHFSEDPGLVESFRVADSTAGDFFLEMAAQVYGVRMDKTDQRRQLTKNTMYGKSYGAGVQKMAETAGVPFEVMEPVVQSVDASFPGMKMFQKLVERTGSQRLYSEGEAYITTPYGRRMPCDEGKVYTLVNYLIQSHAAEIFKDKMRQLDAAGLGEYMVLPVHDELIFDVPVDECTEAALTIEQVMTVREDEGYTVPIPAEPEILLGGSWGSKYA